MDPDVTDDQRALLDVSIRFMEDSCPLGAVRDGSWKDAQTAAAYRHQAAELGWFSGLVPESLGGGSVSGDGVLDATLIAYERGARLQPGSFVGTNVVAFAVARAGGDDLRATVLPTLLSGEASASWAVAGSDPLDAAVEATVLADGGLELTGTRHAVHDADGSWLLVPCTTPAGPAQALVATGADGVGITELDALDLSRRFFEVRLDHVQVGAAAVLRADGLLDQQVAIAATLLTAETVGAMSRDFETTVQYAKDRIAFGRPIGSFQGVKHQLADASTALEMSKAITLAAARTVGAGDEFAPSACSMAKAFVGDAGIDLAQVCFQVFGGIGYTWEHDQHLYLRRITTDAGLFGDPAWHRERLCQLAGL